MRWLAPLLMLGCSGASPGGIPKGTRLITGQLVAPTPAELGSANGSPAFQLVAVHDRTTMYFGEPFDPSVQSGGDATIPFSLELPCDKTVSLHFQRITNTSGTGLGVVVGLLQFPLNGSSPALTTLLAGELDCAAQDGREIRLGTVKIDFAAHRVTLPGDSGGVNPLTEVITQRAMGQTMSNYDNPDDDGDGIPDEMDADEDGDGIDDSQEGITSFMQM